VPDLPRIEVADFHDGRHSLELRSCSNLEGEPAERRDLELKGKSERVPVLVLGATSGAAGY
jgi:hypothetical protein